MRKSISVFPKSSVFTAEVRSTPVNQNTAERIPFTDPAAKRGRRRVRGMREIFLMTGKNPKDKTAKSSIITSLKKSIERGEKYSVSCFPNDGVVDPARIITISAIHPIVVDR